MRAVLAILVTLSLSACSGEPIDGHLPEGVYGSPDLELRIDASGDAHFARSCGVGELGVVTVTDGALDLDFDWVVTGGDPVQDTGEPSGTPAHLDAQVNSARLWGSLESAGSTQEIDLRWGEEGTWFECP